jgi:peptidase E
MNNGHPFNLLLASKGLGAIRQFLPEEFNGSQILTITNAAETEDDWDAIEFDRDQLAAMGYSMLQINVEESNRIPDLPALAAHFVVFCEGGNQVKLMRDLRRTVWFELIDEFVRRGGYYIGRSAGAITAGPYVSYPRGIWERWDREQDAVPDVEYPTPGFGWIPFQLIPHWPTVFRDSARERLGKAGQPTTTIHDEQAILIRGSTLRKIPSPIVGVSRSAGDGIGF